MDLVIYVCLVFSAIMVGLVVSACFVFWRLIGLIVEKEAIEKKQLRSQIRDLEDRISAKDLTGYMTLKQSREEGPRFPQAMTDERMADIENRRASSGG